MMAVTSIVPDTGHNHAVDSRTTLRDALTATRPPLPCHRPDPRHRLQRPRCAPQGHGRAADAGLASEPAFGVVDGVGIVAVGADLLAADKEFGRAVDKGAVAGLLRACAAGEGPRLNRGGLFGGCGRQIFQHALAAALAPEPALAKAAETAGGVEEIGAVDPDHACLELWGNMEGEIDVFRPDGGGEAVTRVVGEFDRLAGGAEADGRKNRAEDLFLGEQVRRADLRCKHRQVEPAGLGQGTVGLPDRGALFFALLDHRTHPIELHLVDQRADIGVLVERVAEAQMAHALPDPREEALGDALLHQEPRAGAADLALVEPDAVHQPLDG